MNVFPLVSFSVFGLTVYGFGLALALGFALAWLCLRATAPKAGLQKAAAADYLLFAVPLSVLLGRVIFCLFRRDAVFYDMVDGHFLGIAPLIKVWEGGFSLPGLLLGLLLAVPLTAKSRGKDAGRVAGWIAAPAALTMAFAHLGTVLAGEGYGAILEAPAFYAVGNAYEEWYVAVFAFEAAVYVVLALLLFFARASRPCGKAIALAIAYGAVQLFFESLHRDNYLRLEANGFVRVNQLLCLVLLAGGLICLSRIDRGHALRKRSVLRFVLLGLTILFVIGAEFYEKLPFPTALLYALSAASCLTLALVAGKDALRLRKAE